METTANALKTAIRLETAVLEPTILPFLLLFVMAENVLRQDLWHECRMLPRFGSSRTAALCHDELDAACISFVGVTVCSSRVLYDTICLVREVRFLLPSRLKSRRDSEVERWLSLDHRCRPCDVWGQLDWFRTASHYWFQVSDCEHFFNLTRLFVVTRSSFFSFRRWYCRPTSFTDHAILTCWTCSESGTVWSCRCLNVSFFSSFLQERSHCCIFETCFKIYMTSKRTKTLCSQLFWQLQTSICWNFLLQFSRYALPSACEVRCGAYIWVPFLDIGVNQSLALIFWTAASYLFFNSLLNICVHVPF